MYWAERNGPGSVPPDPESTKFLLSIYEAPLTDLSGVAITRSPYAKPLAMTMPIDAKAGCLYPNNARALMEARTRGFDNCLLADMLGNVAELATANVFMARDGVVMTPVANGSFLNGVTRQRVLKLLKADGVDVREATMIVRRFRSGRRDLRRRQFGKVSPVKRIESRDLQPGPLFRRARQLYWDFAHSK